MRYFKSNTGWDCIDARWQRSNRIYKRDCSGKMWVYISGTWTMINFNEARRVYNTAKEISEKEAFIEIL